MYLNHSDFIDCGMRLIRSLESELLSVVIGAAISKEVYGTVHEIWKGNAG